MLDPHLLLIVASAGLMLVYREFCAPGKVWPGACGGALFLASSWLLVQQRPTIPGVALLAIAAVLFSAILRFSRAVHFGLGGTTCLIAGLLFLLPGNRAISPWLAVPLGAALGAATSVLARVAAAARRNKKTFIRTVDDYQSSSGSAADRPAGTSHAIHSSSSGKYSPTETADSPACCNRDA